MNEVTQIHLGRQAFTIAVDAQRELRRYLDEIQHVSDPEVVAEVELRMAELLGEQGITAEKVVVLSDVDKLKAQLGQPKDFSDMNEAPEIDAAQPNQGKKLFRDTDNAMLGGVAAGLAGYFGIDVLLIRILFVISVVAGGWGILIYIVLWLLVPEAKTSSDRLRMAGKPVTVDSLKEVVERADVKGAARRANASLAGPINILFRIVIKVIGLALVIIGLLALLALAGSTLYFSMSGHSLTTDNLFPVGSKEYALLAIALGVVGLLSIFVILFGIAIFQRRWPIRVWVTGVLIGLTLVAMTVGGALAGATVPNIRDRYNANVHQTVRSLPAFSQIDVRGKNVQVTYEPATNYSVTLQYYDHPDISKIKTTVSNGTLTLDTTDFNDQRQCTGLCIPAFYNLRLVIAGPNVAQAINSPLPPKPPTLKDLPYSN